ncbi:hypothetical protein AVEN_33890-1 [Araneus ventricosus]|uniref:Uncharacterized protein n=1 Tax=Araneus ventricosus TaxID=182803 RepID=A0A4Y2EKN4_ARAVE|nr:hypothetical protein AVEN_33890-1 [Araneus ventricosus]
MLIHNLQAKNHLKLFMKPSYQHLLTKLPWVYGENSPNMIPVDQHIPKRSATSAPKWILCSCQGEILNKSSPTAGCTLLGYIQNLVDLVVKSRLRSWRVPGSKSDSTDVSTSIGPVARYIKRRVSNILPLEQCGSLEDGVTAQCRPGHLPAVQDYESCPQITLKFLQNT